MARLIDVVTRRTPPEPWMDGDNIPWDEPEFSRRMLAEHLSEDHDLASRRPRVIDGHVERIHTELLSGRPSRILDLACGPGLYLERLARLGHRGVGIDFGPASIEYARRAAGDGALPVEYVQADLRGPDLTDRIDPEGGFDLVMMLYGQINVFRREEAADIVRRATDALAPDGILLFEPLTFDHVRQTGHSPPTWSAHPSGLFADRPHVLLTEAGWDEAERCATERFIVIDADTGTVDVHGLSTIAYTDDELRSLVDADGAAQVEAWPSLSTEQVHEGLSVLVVRT